MKQILSFLGVCVLTLFAASLLVMLILPGRSNLQATVLINKPQKDFFYLVSDFSKWKEWVPWIHNDPEIKVWVNGWAESVGSSIEWNSEKESVAYGKITLVEIVENKEIIIDIDYAEHEPVRGGFLFTPKGIQTEVKWYVDNDMQKGNAINVAMSGYLGLLFASEFEQEMDKGLKNLKSLAEKDSS